MNTTCEVRPVGKDRRAQRQFIRLLWDLYRGDPNWVPPLIIHQQEMVGFRPHPFYENNPSECFLAYVDGKPVGRIAAIVNREHNRIYDERRGFFGFFECIEDPQVAQALFTAACQYLADQGMTDVRGPVNPSLNYELGTLVEGFDTPPTFMMTYNPPYHHDLICGFGFEKTQDLYAYEGDVSMLATLDPKLSFVVEEIRRRFDVRVRPFDPGRFEEEVNRFLDIYNRSLVATWGFVPLSSGEVAHQAKSLKYLLLPELTTFIEVDGKTIGAGFGLMDYNQIIKHLNGRLLPFGWLKLLRGRRKISRIRLLSANILPEFQKWGFGLLALERMLEDVLRMGVTHGEFSWVLESNHLSRKTLERSGVRRIKTYRLYDRSLSDFSPQPR